MADAPIAPQRSKKVAKVDRPTRDDFVNVIPVQIKDDLGAPVKISKARRAKHAKVSADALGFASEGGYRSVQSSHGSNSGSWFFEVKVEHLGETGHCRLGMGTVRAEVEAPCGYTAQSFGFRDVDGSKVTNGYRHPYGAPYKEGDVIGVYIHLPEGGRVMEPKSEIVRWKGRLYQAVQEEEAPAEPLKGSKLGFTVNGQWQGVAFEDFLEGTYYASASLFTKLKPSAPASVRFNFGPDFVYGEDSIPPHLPRPRPFCDAAPVLPPMEEAAPDAASGPAVASTPVVAAETPPGPELAQTT